LVHKAIKKEKREQEKQRLGWKIFRGENLTLEETIRAFAFQLLLPKSEKAKAFQKAYKDKIKKEYWRWE